METLELIQKLPKAELHLHIEGSLEPELMFKLAQRNKIELPFKSVEEIRAAYKFSNLQDFLDIYYQGAAVLQLEEDFYELMMEYMLHCKEDHIVHAEMFFDPQTHTERGISIETVLKGFKKATDEAEKKWGITSKLILCFLRHLSEDEAIKTWKEALPLKKYFSGVGLDSSEVGHPPSKFENVFKMAREAGMLSVAHAGEEGPVEYIYEALDLLKVARIDHGVRSTESEELCNRLIKENMPLTVCPLSNIKLRVFDKMTDHNFKKMLDKGMMVTINSDDPAYFGGYLNKNFIETAKGTNLSQKDICQVAKNSFSASFLGAAEKEKYIMMINKIENGL